MITDLLLSLLFGIFSGVMGLFPSWSLPSSIQGLGQTIGASIGAVDGVFPVVDLGICIGIMIAARLFIAAWATIAWAYAKIPFKFT